jgi:hypothetical protein
MFLKYLILTSILMGQAYASELIVKDGLKSYKINYSSELIKFDGERLELSLAKKSCNQRIIKKFAGELDMAFKRMPKKTFQSPGDLTVIKNQSTFYLSRETASGTFFTRLPEEMKKLKLKETLKCKS